MLREVELPVVLREVVLPVLRLVVAAEELPVERLVRLFWSTELAERLVVEDPVLRLVLVFWSTELAERLVVAEEVLPVERLVVLLPVERLVRSF